VVRVCNAESSQDWWIRTDRGDKAYQVVVARFGFGTFTTLVDRDEQPLAIVRERLTGLRDSATIERPSRPPVAIRRRLTTPGVEAWDLSAPEMGDLHLIGDLVAHRATVWSHDEAIARIHDASPGTGEYRVTFAQRADRVLVLSSVVAIDRLRR
jgi:uncharacterized protein YxjI